MKVRWKYIYGILILSILLGGIGLAQSAGIWSVSGKVTSDGSKIAVTGKDVNEIKGWMTLEEVINGYGLDQEEIYQTFNLSTDLAVSTALKDIAAQTDEALSPTIIREFITEKQQKQ